MKNLLSILLLLFITIVINHQSYSQNCPAGNANATNPTVLCQGQCGVYSVPAANRFRWFVINELTGAFIPGNNVSISTTYNAQVSNAQTVTLSINIPGRFRIKCVRTSGLFGGSLATGDFLVSVPTIQPISEFVSTNCATATLRVRPNTVQDGVAYTWRNPNTNDVLGTGPNLTTTSFAAQVTASGCGISLNSNPGAFPGFGTPSVGPNNFNVCEGDGQIFFTVSPQCVQNLSWTSSGNLQLSFQSGTSAVFNILSSGPASVNATGTLTGPGGVVTTVNVDAFGTILPQGTPQCDIFLRKPKDTNLPEAEAKTKTEKVDVLSEIDGNTEGSKDDVKIGGNNTKTIKKAIYPNPANDFLNVDDVIGVQAIQIIDINGKLIRTIDVEENEISRTLNVSNLSNGMYILKKIKQDGQLEAAKFQVMH